MILSPLRMQKNNAGCRFDGQMTHVVDTSDKYYVEVVRQHTGHLDLAPLRHYLSTVDVLLRHRWSYFDEDSVRLFVEHL